LCRRFEDSNRRWAELSRLKRDQATTHAASLTVKIAVFNPGRQPGSYRETPSERGLGREA